MEILLVDDDLDVIEGIMDGMDWDELDFRQVHLAQSAKKAKEILQERDIAVLLTDIEMPGSSGLDLLEWVRDKQLDVVTLFYTGYASFNYAQKAVELHSFAYFLKPIAYPELQEHLSRAREEAMRLQSLKYPERNSKAGLRESRERLWKKLLLGTMPQSSEHAGEPIRYEPQARFTLCVGILEDSSERVSGWKKYAALNVLDEMAEDLGLAVETLFTLPGGEICIVLREENGQSEALLLKLHQELGSFVEKYLAGWFNLFYARGVALEDAPRKYAHIRACADDDVCSKGIACAAKDYRRRSFPYDGEKVREWGSGLSFGQTAQVQKDICAYLDELSAQGKLNMPFIKLMRIDMMQTIHTLLKQKQVSAHDLFSDERFDSLRANSLRSVEHMKRYLCYVVGTAGEYMDYLKESGSVVSEMKDYISEHYSEDVTRTVLSKVFYLNPDYLSRLFKKKTGVSIGGYLQEVRMREAKELLAHTDTPVNEVAMRVGYDTISYFSHVFKEKTGLAPIEYRRKADKENG